MFSKTRTRLVLLNAIVFFLILNGFGSAIYFFAKQHLYNQSDQTLLSLGQHIQHENFRDIILRRRAGDTDANSPNMDPRIDSLFWDVQGNLQNLAPVDTLSVTIHAKNELLKLVNQVSDSETHHSIAPFQTIETLTLNGIPYRILTLTVQPPLAIGNGISHVQLVLSLSRENDMLRDLFWIISGGSLLSVALAVAAGWFLANRSLIPIQNSWIKQQQFVADASHELRTPLSVTRLHLERLFRHPDQTVEEASEDISVALQETKRMNKLVSDLLTLARSDSNEVEIFQTKLPLGDLVERVVQRFRHVALLKEIEIETHIESPLEFFGDEERLDQLFVILFDNALKYTPDQGRIFVNCFRAGHQIQIGVKDTGVGIPVEELKYIFDRFYRGDKARTRTSEGHGLGLSIAKWIVEAHQGKIRAESELGKGTQIWITFPLRQKG